jgi:hypothetical protein
MDTTSHLTEEDVKRVDQWFIRGIALVVVGLLVTVMIICLSNLPLGLYHGEAGLDPFTFTSLARVLGTTMWTYRAFDMIFILLILSLTIILVNYLISLHKTIAKNKQGEVR